MELKLSGIHCVSQLASLSVPLPQPLSGRIADTNHLSCAVIGIFKCGLAFEACISIALQLVGGFFAEWGLKNKSKQLRLRESLSKIMRLPMKQ